MMSNNHMPKQSENGSRFINKNCSKLFEGAIKHTKENLKFVLS